MTDAAGPFRVAIVEGVTPDKWVRRWGSRHREEPLEVVLVPQDEQVDVLRDGRAQMSFVRLPADREGLHLIPLYSEVQVVVLSKEHPLAEFDALELEDLTDDLVLEGLPAKVAIETVAAGTGIAYLPMSVARLHQRKDVRAVPVPELDETRVGLAWRVDDEDPRIEELIGIVRGRTERSSRGAPPAPTSAPAPRKKQLPKKAASKKPGKRRRR
jgi:DNA-binding transcriptional LysR family regulator